jgi:hypothetical protein
MCARRYSLTVVPVSEQAATSTLRKTFVDRYGAHVQRFEDKMTAGIPDMNVKVPGCHELWLEGKYLKDFPKRETTPVKCGLRPDQALWLNERAHRGGAAFCWVRVRDERWYLFSDDFFRVRDGIALHEWRNMLSFRNSVDMVDHLVHISVS